MRTSLFLSTLFAVSTLGGIALAEKPHEGAAVREPRAVEQPREHGDIVDKVYSAPVERALQVSRSSRVSPPEAGRTPVDPKASRINCADTDADCGSSRGARASGVEASTSQIGRAARAPAFLDKVFGDDRTDFNEAGEDQGMSARAERRAWSHAAAGGHASSLRVPGPQQVDRKEQQASSARMSCNEGDVCSMSSKAARKEWATASIKAGTWRGPAVALVSNAAHRIAAQHAAESASETQTQATRRAAQAEGAAHGAGAAAGEGEHEP
jgi:hypothetical protein